jgi:EAL domain-containing protein (putative c-di-GMP-specific phosphodiesterase class I)
MARALDGTGANGMGFGPENDDPKAGAPPEATRDTGRSLPPYDPNGDTLRASAQTVAFPIDPRVPGLVRAGTTEPNPARARLEWFLESVMDDGKQLRRMLIRPLPFRIGRLPGLDLVLPSQLVSKAHAEIYGEGDGLRLRDLRSTNGTFVNRSRIEDAAIGEGDILHFADFEFRVGQEEGAITAADGHATVAFGNRVLPHHFVAGTRELKELLGEERVTVVFQPIVRIPSGQVVAYEALGRGLHPGLPEQPSALFRIAESLGAEIELSRLFRRKAVALVGHRRDLNTIFLNTHAAEVEQPGLVESLEELRRETPDLRLALEIHESALGLPGEIQQLRARLAAIDVGLAYDDFGAGQARLIELAESPPNFLKFDRRFVSGIDQAPPSKQRLLASLVAAARELLVETIAEGVATAGEAAVVTRVGFTYAQGFLYGHPVAADQL